MATQLPLPLYLLGNRPDRGVSAAKPVTRLKNLFLRIGPFGAAGLREMDSIFKTRKIEGELRKIIRYMLFLVYNVNVAILQQLDLP